MSNDTGNIPSTTDSLHTCSYACERPGCIRAQRDYLAAKLAAVEADRKRRDEPMAWVTADTVNGQTVNGKPRRIWWENNDGVGIPIYTSPQPAEGEEIMVNTAHDVYTLPLQPSGLSSGPRFVVHVPGPEQPTARPPKPMECMNGCPDRQVCDHCQWPPGPDQQPAFPSTPVEVGYAKRLATSLWQQHYREDAPQWEPCEDLMGLLSQIDNMVSGLTRAAQQPQPKKSGTNE